MTVVQSYQWEPIRMCPSTPQMECLTVIPASICFSSSLVRPPDVGSRHRSNGTRPSGLDHIKSTVHPYCYNLGSEHSRDLFRLWKISACGLRDQLSDRTYAPQYANSIGATASGLTPKEVDVSTYVRCGCWVSIESLVYWCRSRCTECHS